MKNPEISRIIHMLQNTYDGAAWHGPSILEVLSKINADIAFKQSSHIHRICELVQHITAWRIFAIKRLEGDAVFEITQNENWKTFTKQDEAAWKVIKEDLAESQETLIKRLSQANDALLDEDVEGKAYDYYTLIHGVIQHDLYHLGEIALLFKEHSQAGNDSGTFEVEMH